MNINIVFARTIYISPEGRDSNLGTLNNPLKSVERAFSTLNNGIDTIYLLKGEYYVNKAIVVNGVQGSKNRKIFISSLNEPATIFFSNEVKDLKVLFINCSNIKISNINFFGNSQFIPNTYDILLSIRHSSFFEIYNCYFKDAYEEGLKVSQSNDVVCNNNIFENFNHEGVDYLNVKNGVICNNKILEVGRVGIMVKGGSQDILVSNNNIYNSKKIMIEAGITVGGMTNITSTRNYKRGSFEAYSVYALNNNIQSINNGVIRRGIAFYGANESYAVNNIIKNTQSGILLKKNSSKKYGWEEDVNNNNINLSGNIFNGVKQNNIEVLNNPKNFSNRMNNKEMLQVLNKRINVLGKNYKISTIINNCNIFN